MSSDEPTIAEVVVKFLGGEKYGAITTLDGKTFKAEGRSSAAAASKLLKPMTKAALQVSHVKVDGCLMCLKGKAT